MLSLRDYLDLTVDDARSQWLSLEGRSIPRLGDRQVDFLPIETLTCFGLGLISPPSTRSGAINLRESDLVVRGFAALFRRTPSSLAAKLSNLNGRRSHGARFERELWIYLTGNDFAFLSLYWILLQSAREAGLDERDVPDYLGAGDERLRLVLDSVDVSDLELEQAVADQLGPGDTVNPDRLTERVMIGTARVGQQQFARRVLANSDYACAFCGLSARKHEIKPSRLLIASHIKPWSRSTHAERLEPRNGIAACPTHDAAFENGLLRIDKQGRIVRSAELERAISADAAWDRAFGSSTLSDRVGLAVGGQLPGRAYIDWHWENAPIIAELGYGAERAVTAKTPPPSAPLRRR